PARVVGCVPELGVDRGADEGRYPDTALGNAGGIFGPPGSGALLGDAGVVRGQPGARNRAAGSIDGEFLRRGFRAFGRLDGDLAAADRGRPDAAHAVRGRAPQYPVSKPGAGAFLYRRPAAAIHRGRDGRARQRTVPGRDRGATLRRANRAGDAVGGVVPRKYAALQGG